MSKLTTVMMADQFQNLGLQQGDVVLVHSSLRAMGVVEGGADAVIDALLEVLGSSGTLVMPTFTFRNEHDPLRIIDPRHEPSDVGILTEVFRARPQTRYSVAFRHRFHAAGYHAEYITQANPEISVFSSEGSFGRMQRLHTKIMLIGLTFSRCTAHHFAEAILQVPYRQMVEKPMKVRAENGDLYDLRLIDYQPKPLEHRPRDFNKLGKVLEERGLVRLEAVGNAYVRLLQMRDLIETAKELYMKDENLFFRTGKEKETSLLLGNTVSDPRNGHSQFSVVDPKRMYASDRLK